MRKFTVLGLFIALASLGAGAACSSTATTTPDPTADGGGTTNPDGSTTNPDGGTTGGAAKGGAVTLTQSSFTVASTTTTSYSAGASFYNTTGTPTGTPTNSTCTTTTDSGCTVIVCDKVTADAGTPEEDAGAPVTPPNAGDITVTALKTLTLSVNAEGGYTAASGQEKLFDNGGQIQIAAAGSDIPAFSDTIASPPSITLTAPTLPALGTTYDIDGSQALPLTWTNGGAGSLSALITATTDTQSSVMTCTFDASTGSATISQAAMGKLLKGKGVFALTTATISAIKAGDYEVSLTASASAATATSEVK